VTFARGLSNLRFFSYGWYKISRYQIRNQKAKYSQISEQKESVNWPSSIETGLTTFPHRPTHTKYIMGLSDEEFTLWHELIKLGDGRAMRVMSIYKSIVEGSFVPTQAPFHSKVLKKALSSPLLELIATIDNHVHGVVCESWEEGHEFWRNAHEHFMDTHMIFDQEFARYEAMSLEVVNNVLTEWSTELENVYGEDDASLSMGPALVLATLVDTYVPEFSHSSHLDFFPRRKFFDFLHRFAGMMVHLLAHVTKDCPRQLQSHYELDKMYQRTKSNVLISWATKFEPSDRQQLIDWPQGLSHYIMDDDQEEDPTDDATGEAESQEEDPTDDATDAAVAMMSMNLQSSKTTTNVSSSTAEADSSLVSTSDASSPDRRGLKRSGSALSLASSCPTPRRSTRNAKKSSEDKYDGVWDLVEEIVGASNETCRMDDCNDSAVAVWATDKNENDEWPMCEKCQFTEFGGWPKGFQLSSELPSHSDSSVSDDSSHDSSAHGAEAPSDDSSSTSQL
jgi:hypothetical protein